MIFGKVIGIGGPTFFVEADEGATEAEILALEGKRVMTAEEDENASVRLIVTHNGRTAAMEVGFELAISHAVIMAMDQPRLDQLAIYLDESSGVQERIEAMLEVVRWLKTHATGVFWQSGADASQKN